MLQKGSEVSEVPAAFVVSVEEEVEQEDDSPDTGNDRESRASSEQ
jgi:hypothetical protein